MGMCLVMTLHSFPSATQVEQLMGRSLQRDQGSTVIRRCPRDKSESESEEKLNVVDSRVALQISSQAELNLLRIPCTPGTLYPAVQFPVLYRP